jgi:hypothetical protein
LLVAALLLGPAAIVSTKTDASLMTVTNFFRSFLSLRPSWPLLPLPHTRTTPSSSTVTVCASLQATPVNTASTLSSCVMDVVRS